MTLKKISSIEKMRSVIDGFTDDIVRNIIGSEGMDEKDMRSLFMGKCRSTASMLGDLRLMIPLVIGSLKKSSDSHLMKKMGLLGSDDPHVRRALSDVYIVHEASIKVGKDVSLASVVIGVDKDISSIWSRFFFAAGVFSNYGAHGNLVNELIYELHKDGLIDAGVVSRHYTETASVSDYGSIEIKETA